MSGCAFGEALLLNPVLGRNCRCGDQPGPESTKELGALHTPWAASIWARSRDTSPLRQRQVRFEVRPSDSSSPRSGGGGALSDPGKPLVLVFGVAVAPRRQMHRHLGSDVQDAA